MKPILAAFVSALVLLPTAWADWVIEAKIESPQMNSSTITKIKGDKVRSDIAGGPMGAMSSIMNTTSGETTQLIHAQKMAMKTSAEQMKQAMEMAQKMSGANPAAPAAKPQATGEKENIGGYDCEIWTWSNGNMSSKFWVAPKHPQAAALREMEKKMRGGFMGAMQSGPDTSALPGPAVKTETTMMGSKTTITIVSVKEQNVDAKEFEVPSDYQAMSLPGLPGAK